MHGVIGQLFAPWRRASTFWALSFTVLNLPAAIVTIPVVVLLVVSVALLVVFPLALPALWVLFAVSHQFCRLERSRVAALLGVRLVDPVPPLTASNWFARLWERVRSGARWREIAYIVLLRPMALLSVLTALVLWCGSLAMIALPFYVDELPGGSAKFWLFEISRGGSAWAAAAAGVLGVALLAPWATVLLGRLDLFIARHLISTGDRVEFEARRHGA